MGIPVTLPTDTEITGNLGHTTDHNTIVDAVQAVASAAINSAGDTMTGKLVSSAVPPFQVTGGSPAAGDLLVSDASGNLTLRTPAAAGLPTLLPPSGDTTQVTDTANIQALLNAGGTVRLAAGSFYVAGLVPVTGSRLTGQGAGATILHCSGATMWNMGPAGPFIDHFELDHLQLNATGGHIFSGANIIRFSCHHVHLVQNSGGFSIWNAPSVALMIECSFSEGIDYAYGAARTANAWHVVSSGTDLVTEIDFDRWVSYNHDSDASEYYHYWSCNASNALIRNLRWRNTTFEKMCAGAIYLESVSGLLIDNCDSWDTPTSSVVSPLIQIRKNASNSAVPQSNVIRAFKRVGDGPNTGVADIQLDSNCTQTLIEACAADGTAVVLAVDCGSSSGLVLVNMPSTVAYSNLLGSHIRLSNGAFNGNAMALSQSASGGLIATIQNTASSPSQPSLRIQGQSSGDKALGFIAAGDTALRWQSDSSGKEQWGPGNAAPDTNLYRSAVATLATDGSFVVGGTFTSQAQSQSSTPTAPAPTLSTTLVMMGLGTNATGTPWKITPSSSGKVLVIVTGLVAVATAVASIVVGCRFGTGAAPANGAAVTGTRFGTSGDMTLLPVTNGVGLPFSATQVLNLTPGTAYWFDLALDCNGTDAASVSNVSISLVEIM
jgi:hypothetical protein